MSSSLLPWNATAINRSSFSDFFFGNSVVDSASQFNPGNIEQLLIKSLLEITQGQLQQALETTEELLNKAPNFKLAHLVRGDLLMARAQQISAFGNSASSSPEAVQDFQSEARLRLENYMAQQKPRGLPEPLWQVDPSHRHIVVVDADKYRLYLYRNDNGKPVYVSDHYVTLGKNGIDKFIEGDQRTPIGIYFAGTKLTQQLPDFYGGMAFPLNYPNEWDRHQGKNGYGIWLHGTASDTYNRPPLASNGCIVMANPELKTLEPIFKSGRTLFVIANNLQWLEANQISAQKESLSKALETWRKDWESQNTEQYLAHYSKDFFSQSTDYNGWVNHKRRVQASKPNVEIKLSNVSMLRYPNSKQEMAVVNFEQSFKSNHLDNRMRKRQYWVLENNNWKIMYEGPG
ncbi:MAG: L,D-transpeptidase family protein [Methylophilaceae bacterium]|nr:L,D-transpeptidase family protein [Methylophilaceae bacterium]